jgi:hypothetical protein
VPISQKIRTLADNAWTDGYPCLLATAGPERPNISPKGSMLVFDDEHLAYWERSKKQALANLGSDKRVCVMYPTSRRSEMARSNPAFCAFTEPRNYTRPDLCGRPSSRGLPSASKSTKVRIRG